MSSSERAPQAVTEIEDAVGRDVGALYARVVESLTATADPSTLDEAQIQDLVALGSRLYADRRSCGERFEIFGARQSEAALTPTDGAIVASAVLDAVSVEVFELGIWRTWGTN